MKILALDLSTKQSGYAVGDDKNLVKHGYIGAAARDPQKRIIKMRDQIGQILKNQTIQKIIMEEVRPQFNSHTNKILMWLQGAIVLKAYEINPKIQCEFIGASEWRAALKIKQGRGVKRDQLKPRDIQYVRNKYNLNVNDDEADAICIFDAYFIRQEDNNQMNWE